MKRFLYAVLAALALVLVPAGSALAAGAFTTCEDYTDPTVGVVTDPDVFVRDEPRCYLFTGEDDSPIFRLTPRVTLWCFDPDANGAGGDDGAAEVMFQKCPSGEAGSCFNLADLTFTGAGGSGTTQRACLPIAGGRDDSFMRIDVTAGPAGVEKPFVKIEKLF